jgi:hypothetical protein
VESPAEHEDLNHHQNIRITMSCATCDRFPVPTSKFAEIADSVSRHGTLHRCRDCGQLLELIAEERSVRPLSPADARRHYPSSASDNART